MESPAFDKTKAFVIAFLVLVILLELVAIARSQDLDLPVNPGWPMNNGAPIADDGNGDDPRDEPPPVFFGEEIDSENNTLVYVLDCSGSMRQEQRLIRAQRELSRSIAALSANFRFNVVVYWCEVRAWSMTALPANEANKASASTWACKWGAGGGTATGPAVALGLWDTTVQAVALLTDGMPNCGAPGREGHRQMIRAKNVQGATINVFGVSASGEWRAWCQAVAADSGGRYVDVP